MLRRSLAFLLFLSLFIAVFAANVIATSQADTKKPNIDPEYCSVIYNHANQKALTSEVITCNSESGVPVKALLTTDATYNGNGLVVSDSEDIALFECVCCECSEQDAFFRHYPDGKFLCSDGKNTTVESNGSSDFNLEHVEGGCYIRLHGDYEVPMYLKIVGDVLTCAAMGKDTENYIFDFCSLAKGEEPTEESTEPTEESTEPTEESTEPTEESTEPTEVPEIDPEDCIVIYNDANAKAITAESTTYTSDGGEVIDCLVAAPAMLNEMQNIDAAPEDISLFKFIAGVCPDHNTNFQHTDGMYLYSDGTHTTLKKAPSDFRLELTNGGFYIRLHNESEEAMYLKIDGNIVTCAEMGADTENYIFTLRSLATEDEKPIVYEGFDDVWKATWFYGSVVFAYEHGLMVGVGNGKFDPQGNVTRAMLVTMLYRNEGEPETNTAEIPFSDVQEDQWYTDAVIWAAENEIVKGMTVTTFEPDTVITREQIATLLCRYAQYQGLLINKYLETGLSHYKDIETVSDYAIDPLKWAVGTGVINGIDGKLAPNEPATRAQIATMLMRHLTNFE